MLPKREKTFIRWYLYTTKSQRLDFSVLLKTARNICLQISAFVYYDILDFLQLSPAGSYYSKSDLFVASRIFISPFALQSRSEREENAKNVWSSLLQLNCTALNMWNVIWKQKVLQIRCKLLKRNTQTNSCVCKGWKKQGSIKIWSVSNADTLLTTTSVKHKYTFFHTF